MNWEKKNLTEKQKKLFDTSVFLGKMLLLGIPFQLFLILQPDTGFFQELHAGLITDILTVLGYQASNQGIDIVMKNTIYRITQDCLGWKSMAAFTGLTLATETKIKSLQVVAIGIFVLFLTNIIRILSTILLSDAGIISYSIIHGTLWKWGLTGIVLILWIAWLQKTT